MLALLQRCTYLLMNETLPVKDEKEHSALVGLLNGALLNEVCEERVANYLCCNISHECLCPGAMLTEAQYTERQELMKRREGEKFKGNLKLLSDTL
jgi:hypothetical protein